MNSSKSTQTTAEVILEMLGVFWFESTLALLPLLLFGLCYRRLGGIESAVVVALAVAGLLCLPPVRRRLFHYLWLRHWRRRFALALTNQGPPFAELQPRVNKVSRVPSGTKLDLTLQSGTALHELEHLCPYLATHFGVGEVRAAVDRADASRVELTICSKDTFAGGPIPWPGVTSENASAWDPISVGVDRDGDQVSLRLIERNLLIGGEPGSGKSVMLHVLIAHLVQCRDAKLYLFDGKSVELQGWSQAAAGFAGPDIDEAIAELSRLRREMEERYQFLGKQGARKLDPHHGHEAIVVVIDELPFYTTNPEREKAREFNELLRDLLARGRAAGIIVIVAAQKPSTDTVPSAIRDLINVRLAFRCTTKDASDTILAGGWAAAGFSATTIAINQRGVGWFLGENGEPELIRGYFIDDATMGQIVEKHGVLPRDNGGEDPWS